MRRSVLVVFFLCLFPIRSWAQGLLPNACDVKVKRIAATAANSNDRDVAIVDALNIGRNASCFAELLAQPAAFSNFLQVIESIRTDKEQGSAAGTGGSTNLVSKGLTAKTIAIAAEYGALTESVDKQVVTIQGTLAGLPIALIRSNNLAYCPTNRELVTCVKPGYIRFLDRFSYSVSFDMSENAEAVSGAGEGGPQGTAQKVTFSANRHQITALAARVQLLQTRDTSSEKFQTAWHEKLKDPKAAQEFLASVKPFSQALVEFLGSTVLQGDDKDQYDRSYREATASLKTVAGSDAEREWRRFVFRDFLPLYSKLAGSQSKARAFLDALSTYQLAEDLFNDKLATEPVLTAEYSHNRPSDKPATSSVRVIFDKGLGKKWILAVNGALTFYEGRLSTSTPDIKRLRDMQFGLQFQRKVGEFMESPVTVSGSYYFQYQNSPAILNVTPGKPIPGITFVNLPATATEVFAEKGRLHVGQVRLVLGGGETNLRFPLAVSYSNRTELITKPTWRAQVGVTYDFDSLFAK